MGSEYRDNPRPDERPIETTFRRWADRQEKRALENRLDKRIQRYIPSLVVGALVGAGLGGGIYGIATVDQLLNPQVINALREQTYWYQYFTIIQSYTPVILDHTDIVIKSSTVLGTLGGLVKGFSR